MGMGYCQRSGWWIFDGLQEIHLSHDRDSNSRHTKVQPVTLPTGLRRRLLFSVGFWGFYIPQSIPALHTENTFVVAWCLLFHLTLGSKSPYLCYGNNAQENLCIVLIYSVRELVSLCKLKFLPNSRVTQGEFLLSGSGVGLSHWLD